MNIYQRVNEVRKKVDYLTKDATVTGYKAITHDQVTAGLRDALVANGIITTISLIGSSFEPTGQVTGSGAKWSMYTALYCVSFINIDEPKDRIEINIQSQALDNADKASGKAMSYAMKYAMLKTFNIETGENEESRQDERREKAEKKLPISAIQAEDLKKLIAESKADEEKLLSYFKINKIEEMTNSDLEKAIDMLNRKRGGK